MPIVKPCRNPSCPNLVEKYGYCPQCWVKESGKDSKPIEMQPNLSASKRGYGRSWQKASKRFLDKNPFCMNPYGFHQPFKVKGKMIRNSSVKATLVDHVKPHRQDMGLFWDESNWQGLCHSCHSHKTLVEKE